MIIFIDDDRAYLYWVTHHRQGFVVDGRRQPRLNHLVLHRATCAEIKSATSKRTRWTTGGRLKACGLDRDALREWVSVENETPFTGCPICQPEGEPFAGNPAPEHLSKLESDILDYVLEAALIHMESDRPLYHLTVINVADCMGKTPGQVSPAIHRLFAHGYLTTQRATTPTTPLPPARLLYPTVAAMRTLTAFAQTTDAEIQTELAKLCGDE